MYNRDAGAGMGMGTGTGLGMVRRRSPHLDGVTDIDPRDYELLRKFMTEQGKILSARFTGASPKLQRKIARAVRRARVMGLLR